MLNAKIFLFISLFVSFYVLFSLLKYVEEILHSSSAIWMSSDGFLMLFGTFNDSLVEEQKFAWYGTANPATGSAYLYPEIRSLR